MVPRVFGPKVIFPPEAAINAPAITPIGASQESGELNGRRPIPKIANNPKIKVAIIGEDDKPGPIFERSYPTMRNNLQLKNHIKTKRNVAAAIGKIIKGWNTELPLNSNRETPPKIFIAANNGQPKR